MYISRFTLATRAQTKAFMIIMNKKEHLHYFHFIYDIQYEFDNY